MAGMSKVLLIGNVGKAPTTKQVGNGMVTEFSLAVNTRQKDAETTAWYRIACWGRLAETAQNYVTQGKQVFILGRLTVREYQGNDGQQRYSLDVSADDLQLLGSKGDGQEGQQRQQGGPAFGDDFDADQVPF